MLIANTLLDWYQISYSLAGFDRPSFVSDITDSIREDDTCQIARLSFVGDGIQARGQLTIRVRQPQGFTSIGDRLRAVKGMVCVQTD
jgi:hypothetical protein